ncbi:MAG: nucleotidyltransferase domain-containing protein [Planctomycetes bacterium]|nr:nucleotidyltransferase domain-containing protein [Planctomycetota bacterium]
MGKKDILRAVRFLERRLAAHGLDVNKVVLFGSQARGDATPDSDVDIAIVSEDFRGRDILPDELASDASPLALFASAGVAL